MRTYTLFYNGPFSQWHACNFTLDKILDISSVFFIAIISSFLLSMKFKDKIPPIPIGLFIAFFLGIFILTLIFIDKNRSKVILKIFYHKIMGMIL